MAHPFGRWRPGPDGDAPAQGLGRGLHAGAAFYALGDAADPVVNRHPLGFTTFRTRDLDVDGGSWVGWEFGWTHGPVRLGFERVEGEIEDLPTVGGGRDDLDQITSWTAHAAVQLAGRGPQWERGRWVSRVDRFAPEGDPPSPPRDRLELAARYSDSDIDRDLFANGYAMLGAATQEVRVLSLALNWFPTEQVRVSLGWFNTIADENLRALTFTRRDSSFVLRLDVDF